MTELALLDSSAPVVDVTYWTEMLVFAARVAEKVSDTEFVSAALRGRPEAVAAVILYGAEVGITPMQALQGIHIVEGRPSPSSELMRALILRAGHSLMVHESTGTRCRMSGLRKGRPEAERVVVEWSLDMARAAGLLGRRNWQNYPRAMLTARASGDLARTLFPDVIKGLGYVVEDASAEWEPEPVPERTTGPRRSLQRRSRTVEPPRVEDLPLPPVDVPVPDSVAPIAPSGESVSAEDDRERQVRAALRERPSGPVPEGAEPALPDELEPEPSAPEPSPPASSLIAAGPLKAIHTCLTRELGTAATREEKHAMVAAILGHPISSTKDLTRWEGIRVLDYMDRFQSGSAGWLMDPDTGAIAVRDLREPPDELPREPDDWKPGDVAPDGSVDVRLPYKDDD